MSDTDLLGRPLDGVERDVLDVYDRLQKLAKQPDLAPCVNANVRFALASMWQIVNDLNLRHDIDTFG